MRESSTPIWDNDVLTISALHTSYDGIEALRGANLAVSAGEVVAIIGANGSGKTTLINTVSGVLRPQAGRVKFDGVDVTGFASHDVARRGLIQVPEGRRILGPLTVQENLKLGREARGSRDDGTDDLDRVFTLFPRLRERVRQPAGSLSGGEQQMLAIGRALMGHPRLLMLDEPSLGLAPVIVTQVFDALAALNQAGLTILLVEQNARRALDIADRAYVLERGRIVRTDKAAVLKTDPAIKASYLGIVERDISAAAEVLEH
jgi:branched-chain amino acid transport system ATP-binding protein